MTKNKNNKKPKVTVKVVNSSQPKKQNAKPKAKKQAGYTPFADVGGHLGGMFGPLGRAAGRWLGSGIGSIFGSGDYQISDNSRYNVLTSPKQIPQFASNKQANVICHREFVGDVIGSTNFKVTDFPINPGNHKLFPWLSNLAENFEQYKLHGCILEFRSTSTDYSNNAALGSVIMATQYDPYNTSFKSKQEMENYEFAVSCKPSQSMLHGIECATKLTPLSEMFIQSYIPSGSDQRFANLGTFSIATSGMSSAYVAGELWISYCVELIKPHIPTTFGGDVHSIKLKLMNASTTLPFGQPQLPSNTNITSSMLKSVFKLDPSTMVPITGPGDGTGEITLSMIPGNTYSLTLTYVLTGAPAPIMGAAYSLVGATQLSAYSNNLGFNNNTSVFPGFTNSSTNSAIATWMVIFKADSETVVVKATQTGSTAIPTSRVDFLITPLDSSITI